MNSCHKVLSLLSLIVYFAGSKILIVISHLPLEYTKTLKHKYSVLPICWIIYQKSFSWSIQWRHTISTSHKNFVPCFHGFDHWSILLEIEWSYVFTWLKTYEPAWNNLHVDKNWLLKQPLHSCGNLPLSWRTEIWDRL